MDEEIKLETQQTYAWVFEQCLIMLHPFMPFITEEIWLQRKDRKKLIIHQTWPDLDKLSNIDITAGLSLGEYSALVYSNCLDLSDAVKLVNYRGRLMQEAVPEGTAGMLVVLNMPINDVYKMNFENSIFDEDEVIATILDGFNREFIKIPYFYLDQS